VRFSTRGVLAALLVLLLAGVCVRLGFWQLDRLAQRRARNAAVTGAMKLPALPLRDSFAAVLHSPDRYVYRRVAVRGVYDPAGEVLLRGRSEGGRPGVHLVAPLLVAGDTVVMVNRGWVPAADASTVDPRSYAEPGMREVEGVLLPSSGAEGASPLRLPVGGTMVQSYSRLPLDSLGRSARYALLPLYLQQLGGSPAPDSLPHRVSIPPLDEGPHLGYAVQWFSFAAIALIGLVVLLRRDRRGRG
jgi:surfeit locus 1 family protein